jgi:CheY-like chemotaxis protein
MNLTYKIVWFEDSDEFVDSLKSRIEDHLNDLGFSTKIVSRRASDGSLEIVQQEAPDLLLVDFNLTDGQKGQEIVQVLRRHELFTDVIFYAQREDLMASVGRLDGVYYTNRVNLREKIPKIINLTVKRQQDAVNMRGIIIAETVDIERKMECFIAEYFASGDVTRQAVFERLFDYTDHALTLMHKFKTANRIFKKAIELLANKIAETRKQGNTEAATQLETLMTRIQSEKKVFDKFQEIIKVRDVMAHWEGRESALNYQGTPIDINDEYCKQKRKELVAQSKNLESLMNDAKETFRIIASETPAQTKKVVASELKT